jgi:hypothetical protein
VFEKVVYKHIFNFLMENALIYKFQSGFLPGHSTTHQLIKLINEIFNRDNMGKFPIRWKYVLSQRDAKDQRFHTLLS